MAVIKLQTSDNEIFVVDIEVAKCSGTIRNMLDECRVNNDDEESVLRIPNVNSVTLRRILQWAIYHHNYPEPTVNSAQESIPKRSDDISPWDANFLLMDQVALFNLTLAANYLDIKELLELTSKAIANMIKGKTPEEIRRTFNIKNDFTPEEARQVRRENDWCEKDHNQNQI